MAAKWLKKIGKVVGKGLQIASPILAATGVGMPLAIAAGATGGALQGGKPKEWLKRAAIGGGTAALGGVAGKLASGSGGVGKLAGKVGGALVGRGGAPGGAPGGLGGALPSLLDIGQIGLGAYGAYQGNKDMGRARDLDNRMLDMQEQEWAAGAPMRDQARQLAMQQPQGPPSLGSLFQTDNPFARRAG